MADFSPVNDADLAGAAVLSVDLAAIAANARALKARAPHSRLAAVVKADAYGLGAARIAPVLSSTGIGRFYVAQAQEALALRAILGAGPEIAVLHGATLGEEDLLLRAAAAPVLGTFAQVEAWIAVAQTRNSKPAFDVQIDVGMRRLGLDVASGEAAAAAGALEAAKLRPGTVLGHLSCSEDAGHASNARALAAFQSAASLFSEARRSLANTGAVFLGADYHLDEIRPGIGLYGLDPRPGHDGALSTLVPATALTAPILQIRRLPRGQSYGYGEAFVAPQDMTIAILAHGYADGVLRAKIGAVYGHCAGARTPVLGRVSMDLTAVDISDAPQAREGDRIEFFGKAQSLGAFARQCDLIPYEALTGLSPRVRRLYREGAA